MKSMTMKSMSRSLTILGLALAVFAADATLPASTASAQEIQITGPLAGQPAVRRMRLYRKTRLLLEPNFSFTLQDEFVRTLFVGLHAGFYFTDWIGIGAWGAYGIVGLPTGLTDEIEQGGVTTDRNELSLPSRGDFDQQVANLTWAAALQLEFIPLRGKLAIFEKLFVDTDFYIFLGAAFVGVEERTNVSFTGGPTDLQCPQMEPGRGCLINSQRERTSRVAIAPTFGVGLSLMFNDFVGLNMNWRGMPFSWNRSGTDESGDPDGDFPDGVIDDKDRFFGLVHMFQIGLSIYLPTAPDITE